MFCNSDSCDSAICRPDYRSGPVVMAAFYFLYSPFPLFTGVSGSQTSRKLNFRFGPGGVGCSVANKIGGDHGLLERRRAAPARQRAGAQEDRPGLARADGW
jgi:hypothetical protein